MNRMSFIALQAIVILFFSFLIVGCSKDEPINPVSNSKPTLAFSLSVVDISIGGTRALKKDDENLIKDVKLLLFDESYKLVEMYAPVLKEGGTTSSVYTVEVERESYESAVLIANADKFFGKDFVSNNIGKLKEEILSSLIVASSKWNTDSGSDDYMPIPMWGEVEEVYVNKGANVTNVITFQMLRMLARINVYVEKGVGFKLHDVGLYNYYNKGAVVPAADSLLVGKAEVKGVTIPKDAFKPNNAIQSPYIYTSVSEDKSSLTNEIYTFEAEAGSKDNYLKNTALVIGGKFGGDTEATYYRVDFMDDDVYLPLLRNHTYSVNVLSVYGSGQSTPESAFESLESLLKVKIVEWKNVDIDTNLGGNGGESGDGDDKDESGGEEGGNGSEVGGGDDGDGDGDGDGDEGDGDNDLPDTVRSESNSYIMKPDELIHIPVSRANKSDLGIQLESGDTFTAELLWQDEVSLVSKVFVVDNDYLGVKAGGKNGNAVVAIKKDGVVLWSWHIWVTDYNPSGEWMDRNLGATSNEPGSVGVFGLYYEWGRKDPFPGSASVSNNKQKTIYDIDGKEVDIVISNSPTPSSGGNNLNVAIANPTTYYKDKDWYGGGTSLRNNDLWGSGQAKSVYDPCPEGYRVPSYTGGDMSVSPWNTDKLSAHSSKKGYVDDQGYFYPYAGNLSSYGAIQAVGDTGLYWSATISEKNPHSLKISYSSASMSSELNRVSAKSVRCIRD